MAPKAQLAIVGLPGAGKTTLALKLRDVLGLWTIHTDAVKDRPWEEQPDLLMATIPDRCIVEGITVARLFRRGFEPDCVVWMLGGDHRATKSLQSLINRGLGEYSGRVIVVPKWADVRTVLWKLGTPDEHDA